MKELEDFKSIISDCIAGSQKAQAKLYHHFAPKMFGVCLRYAKDATEAEDNLQEGFVKVFTNLKSFRQDGSFEGWIRRIMINVSLEKLRKQHLMYPVEDVAVYDSINYSDDVIAQISANDLLKLVQELPPRYRLVFNLYVIDGMSHQEIAKEMSITQGTSKSNLARAREILKKKVLVSYGELPVSAAETQTGVRKPDLRVVKGQAGTSALRDQEGRAGNAPNNYTA